MLKAVWTLALAFAAPAALAAAPIFPDNVESPLPGKKTALLVAFGDAVETSFPNGVPQCTTLGCSFMGQLAADFSKRGYGDVTTMIATRFNQLSAPEGAGYFSVDDFRNQITGSNAHRYGVFVSYGHAGSLEGGIAVENYQGETTQSQLDTRVEDLVATPRYVAGELFAFSFGTNERVVAITKEFIANQAQFADKSYAFTYGCKTFAAFNRNTSNPNDPTTADITFLDPRVGGVYFVGVRSLCPANNTVYYPYLRKMLGEETIAGKLSNYTVKQALDDDTSTLLVARSRDNDVSVDRMRLWNQAKILKGELKQGTNDIYQYTYADQVFPFNQAFYPGDLSQAALRSATAGELTAKFTFSAPMDPTWTGFKVKLIPPGSGTPLDFVNDAWTQTNFPNDTWTGRVTIPSSDPGWEGTVTVSVTARDAGKDSDDPGGTLDNDGDGATDGPSTLVSFSVDRGAQAKNPHTKLPYPGPGGSGGSSGEPGGSVDDPATTEDGVYVDCGYNANKFCSAGISGPSGDIFTVGFPHPETTAKAGPWSLRGLAPGDYQAFCVVCGGERRFFGFPVEAGVSGQMRLWIAGDGPRVHSTYTVNLEELKNEQMTLEVSANFDTNGVPQLQWPSVMTMGPGSFQIANYNGNLWTGERYYVGEPRSVSFWACNQSEDYPRASASFGAGPTWAKNPWLTGGGFGASTTIAPWSKGGLCMNGALRIPYWGQPIPGGCSAPRDGSVSVQTPIPAQADCRDRSAGPEPEIAWSQNRVPAGPVFHLHGSALAFATPADVEFRFKPAYDEAVDTATLSVYRYDETQGAWEKSSLSSQTVFVEADGTLRVHAQTSESGLYMSAFDLPTSLPDAKAPTLGSGQVSTDGAGWADPSSLLSGTTVWARMSVQDIPFSVQLVSGVSTTTAVGPLAAVSGTLLLFHLDEGAGTTSADASGHGVSINLAQSPAWSEGRFGSGVHFNGPSNQYGSFSNSTLFGRSVFSVGLWVKPSAAGTSGTVFRNYNNNYAGYYMGLSNGKPYAAVAAQSPNETVAINAKDVVEPGQWHYFVMTYDGSVFAFYVDGALKGRASGRLTTNADAALGNPGVNSFVVDLDELRLLNYAQAPEEVLLEYRRGYGAQYSTDGGYSWLPVPPEKLDYGGALEGNPGPYTLSASALPLAESTWTNRVMFYAQDVSGHLSTAAISVIVPPADLTPPAFDSAQASAEGASWQFADTLLPGATVSVRLQVQDPVVGIARTNGLSTTTAVGPLSAVAGTLLLFHLDEGAGTTAADASGHGVTVTLQQSPAWMEGRFGSGVRFDGPSRQYGSFSNSTLFARSVFSVGLWVKPSAAGASGTIFRNYNNNYAGYGMELSNGKPSAWVAAQSPNEFSSIDTREPLAPGRWHYFVLTFDGSNMAFYVNGALKGRKAARFTQYGGAQFANSSVNSLVMDLDEFRLLNYAQSAEEILLEYQRGYGAQYSTDGGAGWTAVPLEQLDYGGAQEGGTGPYTLTASGLRLAESSVTNRVMFYALDTAARLSSTTLHIQTPPRDLTPPAQSDAQVSNDGMNWYRFGTMLAGATVYFRATVQDPAVGIARTSGLNVSTGPSRAAVLPLTKTMLRFDEGAGTTSADESGTGTDATLNNGVTWIDGRFGKAVRLNGLEGTSASNIKLNNYTRLSPAGVYSFSTSLWIRTEDAAETGALISNASNSKGWHLYISNGKPGIVIYSTVAGMTKSLESPERITSDEWHQVAATFDGTNLVLYVDGVSKGQVVAGYTVNEAGGVTIGRDNWAWTNPFKGGMDDLRVMAGNVMSATQIAQDYRRGYGVAYSVDSGTSWTQVPQARLDFAGATDGTLQPYRLTASSIPFGVSGSSNMVRVSAWDIDGNLSTAAYAVAVGADSTPPMPPVLVSAQGRPGGGVELSWQETPGEPSVSYDIYRATEPVLSPEGRTPIRTGVSVTTLVDEPGFDGLYYYAVAGVDLQGNASQLSNTLSAIVDRSSPVVTGLFPAGGERFVAGSDSITVAFMVLDNIDPAPMVSARLVEVQDTGAPRGSAPASVPVSSGMVLSPLDIDDGLWVLRVSATDSMMNAIEVAGGTFAVVHGETLLWAKTVGGLWSEPTNWSGGRVPGALDDVSVDMAAGGIVDASAQPVSFRTLTLGGSGGADTLKLSQVAVGGDLLIRSGGVLEQQGRNQLVLSGTMTVLSGGKLTHTTNGGGFSHQLSVKAGGDIILAAGSSVDARGRGYAGADVANGGGYGPGGGGRDGNSGGAGAGHGGKGGTRRGSASTAYGGVAYDDLFSPSEPGSGGSQLRGGAGGGVILLEAAGKVRLDGVLDVAALAGDRRVSDMACCGGGGSGGTIRVRAASIEGAGALDASGGDGYPLVVPGYYFSSGGGAAGRVSLSGAGAKVAPLNFRLEPGRSGDPATAERGGAGTLVLLEPGQDPSLVVTASSAVPTAARAITPISIPLRLDRFMLAEALVESTGAPQELLIVSSAAFSGRFSLSVSTLGMPVGPGMCTIPAGSTVSAMSFSPTPGAEWTIDGNFSVGSAFEAASLLLRGSMTATSIAVSGDLTLAGNSWLGHRGGFLSGLNLAVGQNMIVAAGARVDASSRGYPAPPKGTQAQGPGASSSLGGAGTGGAGHGAYGADGVDVGYQTPGGVPYDSMTDPRLPGSAAGPGNLTGAAGGGVVIAVVSGTLTLDGVIDASGANGIEGSGGGSGGSVNLTAATLGGAGRILANGGAGAYMGGGGGAGGRIAVLAAGAPAVGITYSAAGGRGADYSLPQGGLSRSRSGGGGTVYLRDPSSADYALQVGGPNAYAFGHALTYLDGPLTPTSFKLEDAALYLTGIRRLSVASTPDMRGYYELYVSTLEFPVVGAGQMTVNSGAYLQAQYVSSAPDLDWLVQGRLELTAPLQARNLTVESGGLLSISSASLMGSMEMRSGATLTAPQSKPLRIDAGGSFLLSSGAKIDLLGKGYTGSSGIYGSGGGPGGGGGGSSGGGGGSHGGRGGKASGGAGPGPVYDDPQNPIDFGSGGGDGGGGNGGGAFWAKVQGDFVLDGSIEVSGQSVGANLAGGAGAGGSVHLCDTPRLSGAGNIRANGGAGSIGSLGAGGGGGGGRICAPVDRFTGTITALGGTALDGAQSGEAGSIHRLPATVASTDSVVGLVSYLPNETVTVVSTSTPAEPFVVAAARQTLFPLAPFYELSPSPVVFDPPALLSFTFDAGEADTTTIAIYRYDTVALEWSSAPIRNQTLALLADGSWRLTGELHSASLYGVFMLAPDTLPPSTLLVLSTPSYSGERLYAGPATFLGFQANDAAPEEARAAGVERTEYRVDSETAAFITFGSAFTLPQGVHLLEFRSIDKAGNVEIARSTSVVVDGIPPASIVSVGTPSFISADGTQSIEPETPILLSAMDPPIGETGVPGAGVAGIDISVDSGSFTRYSAPFFLGLGRHTLAYRSADNVSNLEGLNVRMLDVLPADTTPPALVLVPADRSTVTTASPVIVASYSDDGRGIDTGTVRLSLDGTVVSSSAVVGTSSAAFISAGMLAQGPHVAAAEVADLAGNRSSATAAFFVDSLPPETTLLVGGAPLPGGSVVLTSSDSIGFAATDAGVGVDRTLYVLDGAAPAVFSSAFSVALGTHTLSFHSVDGVGNAEEPKLVSLDVLAVDTMTPILAMQPTDGSTVTTALPSLGVVYSDVGRGMDLSSVRLALDGVDMTSQAVITPSSASFTPASALSQGAHSLTAQVADLAGNQATASVSFFIDSLPPLTTLRVNGQAVLAGALIIASTDTLSFTATDAGVGVAQTLYAMDGGDPVVYAAAFSLTAGAHTLVFHSTDKAGNVETAQTVALSVTPAVPSTDTPPVRLLVLGNSRMLHHPWDADGRGGKVYVADTNADRVLVLDGSGGFLAAYGNVRREEPYFEKPRALAVDGSGNIFVADTQHHRVVKLSAQGAFAFDIGDVRTKKGNKSFHPGSGNAQFRHPSGIALAPDGKIVVSDTGNRRIQVFNADGSFVRAIALPSTNEDFDWDDEDFDRDEPAPFGLDVDATGAVYVADAKGHRALVFNADGTLRLSAGRNGNAAGAFRRPEGIAAAPDGGFYVSDRKLDRITKFDAQGHLRYTLGQHGEIKDSKPLPQNVVFNKPIGLSFDEQGRLYVADRNNERVQVFGPALVLAQGEGQDEDKDGKDKASKSKGKGIGVAAASSSGEDAQTEQPAELPAALAALDAELARSARSTLEKEKGGKVLRQDKAAVEVPAAALEEDLELTVAAPAESAEHPERKEAREEKRLATVSEPVEYGPEGTTFAVPVTITLPYDKDALLARGVSEEAVKVHYWNPDRKEWEELSSTVDKDARTVSAKTTHFSLYQALAPEGDGTRTALTDSEAEFYFRDLYVFPNPARAGAKPTVHIAVGVADSVSVRFYDVSGKQVHETSIDRAPVVMDDGSGSKYVYEYVWDGHIPSGVYFYAVEARRGGHGSIKRTGKLAVVR